MTPSNVVVLSADPLVEMVVRFFLPVEQYTLQRCEDRAVASSQLEQGARLAVLDMPEVDADGLAFIRQLHAQAGKPLIVMTTHPELLANQLEPAVRLLPRPPQLNQLQLALNAALAEPVAPATVGIDGIPVTGWRRARHHLVSIVGGIVLAAVTIVLVGPMLGIPGIPNVMKLTIGFREVDKVYPPMSVKLLPGKTDEFDLLPEAAQKMKLPKGEPIRKKAEKRLLTMSGTLAFNPDRLARIQSRFPGEVVALGTPNGKPIDEDRQSNVGRHLEVKDPVHEKFSLAIVWCKDLGEKKSDLVDALSQLSLDRESLRQLQNLDKIGAATQSSLRAADRAVQGSRTAVNKAERTLRTWKVSEEEIKAVEDEAKRLIERKEKLAPGRVKDWARVEIVSPIDGVIVEKNVVRGNIIDSTQDLFKVADLTSLAVYAHVYEEDQPELQKLLAAAKKLGGNGDAPIVPWNIYLSSDPNKRSLVSPTGIKRLGLIVDPNQHTNIAMGLVENKDQRLTVGQFVTAEVKIPPPPNVVSIPVGALDEDGDVSHVLVQLEANRHRYALRRVRVMARYLKFAYVSSKLSVSDKANGISELKPGDLVVTDGAVQLKAALDEAVDRAKVPASSGSGDKTK